LTGYVCHARRMELPIPRSPGVTNLKKWNFKGEAWKRKIISMQNWQAISDNFGKVTRL
jgi:hypothetical protein